MGHPMPARGDQYRRLVAGSTSLWEALATGASYTTLRKISADGTPARTLRGAPITINVSAMSLASDFEKVTS